MWERSPFSRPSAIFIVTEDYSICSRTIVVIQFMCQIGDCFIWNIVHSQCCVCRCNQTWFSCACMLSHVWLFETPGTATPQASLSMGIFKQEYWCGLPFLPPGDLPDPGIEPVSPALPGGFFTTEPPGKTLIQGDVDLYLVFFTGLPPIGYFRVMNRVPCYIQ